MLRRAQASLTVDDAPSTTEVVASRRTRAQLRLHGLEVELSQISAALVADDAPDDDDDAAVAQ